MRLTLGLAIGLAFAAACPVEAGNLFVLDQLEKDVKEFDAATGAFLGSFGETAAELSTVRSMAFHPVTGNLFVADVLGVQEFDGETGAFLGTFGETAGALSFPIDLEFEPISHDLWIVENFTANGNGEVRRYNGETGAFIDVVPDTSENLSAPQDLAFHPLQDLFLVGGIKPDAFGGEVGVWKYTLSTPDFIDVFGDSASVDAIGPMVFDPVTNNLVARQNNSATLRVFDEAGVLTNTFAATNVMQVNRLAFHPETNVLLVADALKGEITQVDGITGDPLGAFGETAQNLGAPIDLAFQAPEPNAAVRFGVALATLLALAGSRRRLSSTHQF